MKNLFSDPSRASSLTTTTSFITSVPGYQGAECSVILSMLTEEKKKQNTRKTKLNFWPFKPQSSH